jgi:hypothetical protein
MKKLITLYLLILLLPGFIVGQGKDSIQPPSHFNVIKFNPTPMLLWENLRNITLSYERSVNKNQSIAIQLGYLDFLVGMDDTVAGIIGTDNKSKYGINASLDYRFYPLKLNKFGAPRGLYLGPYISYYGYKSTNNITLLHNDNTVTGDVTTAFNYLNLGFELGYQFIFWKHFSIDLLLFGPSVTCTFNSMNFDNNFSEEDQQTILSDMRDKLKEKYPYLGPSIDIEGEAQSVSFKAFFRYSISLGYRF